MFPEAIGLGKTHHVMTQVSLDPFRDMQTYGTVMRRHTRHVDMFNAYGKDKFNARWALQNCQVSEDLLGHCETTASGARSIYR